MERIWGRGEVEGGPQMRRAYSPSEFIGQWREGGERDASQVLRWRVRVELTVELYACTLTGIHTDCTSLVMAWTTQRQKKMTKRDREHAYARFSFFV